MRFSGKTEQQSSRNRNVQFSCSGQGGRADEERAGEEEEYGGADEDGGGGSDDIESCDKLPGLIQKARRLSSPFHSHIHKSQFTPTSDCDSCVFVF